MNEKTVSLCIRCGKVTANLLKAAMVKALAKMEQEKKQRGQKISQKQPQKEKEDKGKSGKHLTGTVIYGYCSMSWCYPTSSLSIAPRLTKRHETAWS